MANNVEVWLELNNTQRRALSIPLDTCMQFALSPLPWLSHLAFTICGSKGYITDKPNGHQIEYRPAGAQVNPGIYYYIAEEPPSWIDIDMMDDRDSYSSESARTARRADSSFKQDIIDRDGTCVMTGTLPRDCQACHIVPYSKGDQYIINLADDREESSFEGINDIRNGLLLYTGFHRPFGESRVAFLRTPNHAMVVTDVDYVQQPNAVAIGPLVEKRFTLQHFEDNDPVINLSAPHNSDARISDSAEWPSDLVFDVSYGCAALKRWGDPAFVDLIRGYITNINRGRGRGRGRGGRRPGVGGKGGGRSGGGGNGDTVETRAQRAARREQAKAQATDTADPQDDYGDVVFALWTQNAKKRQHRANTKKADETRDEVQKWLNSPHNQV